jgi:hypothetical protein
MAAAALLLTALAYFLANASIIWRNSESGASFCWAKVERQSWLPILQGQVGSGSWFFLWGQDCLPFDELPKDFFRSVVGCTFLEILLICRGLGKENIVTPREAQPSALNPVHGSIAKRFSGNPDAEKAQAEFEDAQRPKESFRQFVAIDPASR